MKPVSSEDDAKDFISTIRKEHRKATHNVPVYLIGSNYEIQKYSDDGEPTGTAGLPILRMLINEEVSNLVIVVTRYFGGIKLGKGGLVRAYTSSAKLGLEASKLSEVLQLNLVEFELDYSLQSKFLYTLENNFVYYEKDVRYADLINYSYYLPHNQVDSFKKVMVDLTSGTFSFLSNTEVEGVLLNKEIEEVTCIEKF